MVWPPATQSRYRGLVWKDRSGWLISASSKLAKEDQNRFADLNPQGFWAMQAPIWSVPDSVIPIPMEPKFESYVQKRTFLDSLVDAQSLTQETPVATQFCMLCRDDIVLAKMAFGNRFLVSPTVVLCNCGEECSGVG